MQAGMTELGLAIVGVFKMLVAPTVDTPSLAADVCNNRLKTYFFYS